VSSSKSAVDFTVTSVWGWAVLLDSSRVRCSSVGVQLVLSGERAWCSSLCWRGSRPWNCRRGGCVELKPSAGVVRTVPAGAGGAGSCIVRYPRVGKAPSGCRRRSHGHSSRITARRIRLDQIEGLHVPLCCLCGSLRDRSRFTTLCSIGHLRSSVPLRRCHSLRCLDSHAVRRQSKIELQCRPVAATRTALTHTHG
jgi:hypothetical protein